MYLLKYRSRGKSVQLLQELLNTFGQELEADGYFGRITEAAVKEFQQQNELTADGIVYTQTWANLLILPPTFTNQTPLTPAEINRLQQTLLKKGSKENEAVKILQELLNQVGYDLGVDGAFGRGTETVVKDFQQKNGLLLDGDGLVFTKTWTKLLELTPATINQTPLTSEEINRLKQTSLERNSADEEAVRTLQALLNHLDYNLSVDGDFGRFTERAVKDFQQTNDLVLDDIGVVSTNTWAKLLELNPSFAISRMRLSEKDYVEFANAFDLEVPIVKAVQEVESRGSGFLKDNRPIILFEGHIFWRELKKRGFDPATMQKGNENILFPRFNRAFYEGNEKEYIRLEKARNIGKSPKILEAALASCSWGMFQIMGFNYKLVDAFDVIDYVTKAKRSEAAHLQAFGEFIKSTKLLKPLREKRWADFARGYNGRNFAVNQYDKRLKNAYLKHSATPLLG